MVRNFSYTKSYHSPSYFVTRFNSRWDRYITQLICQKQGFRGMAAERFPNLMEQLKIVSLQDSAILQAQTPSHAT